MDAYFYNAAFGVSPGGPSLPAVANDGDSFYLTVGNVGLYVKNGTVHGQGWTRMFVTTAVEMGGGGGGAEWGDITGTLANQTDLQTVLNAKGTSNFSGIYADLTGKPALFDGVYASLTGKPTLGTAAATAIGDYATAAQGTTANSALQPAGNGSALTGLTKTQVGLANADNTSDANKPVSTATQTALDAKQATSAKGQPNGYAGLDGAGLVPVAQLPGLPTAWGAITGVLSAQTDLQSALDAKQPLDADLTTIAGLTATTNNFLVSVASAWASRTPAQVKTTLAIANTDVSGLGTLSTQNGTFSGTSSGTNTGDQASIVGITGTLAQFNTAITDADLATGGGTATGTNTGDQSSVSGNAGTATALSAGADRTKLDGIAAGAEVNVNADWNAGSGDAQILNKPATFAPSAHATSHQNGGSDEVNVAGLSGVLADPQPPIIGGGAAQAVAGNDARLTDARTPTAHATSHQNGGGDEISVVGLSGLLADGQTPLAHKTSHQDGGADELALDASQVTTGQFTMARLASGTPSGSKFIRDDGVLAVPAGGGGGFALTAFTKDLGAARRSGTFDITGLSGLTANAPVVIAQTAAPITAKGDARDEGEMDQIQVTGYVVDAATIRAFWQAPSVVVGSYNFGYAVSA